MTDMPTIERVREPKVYCGNRGRFNTLVEVRQRGVARPLELRLDLFNHSPTGFEWGSGGSGPAQLALAILADHLGDDATAVRLHSSSNGRLRPSSIAPAGGCRRARSTVGSRSVRNENRGTAGKGSRPAKTSRRALTVRRKGIGARGRPGGEQASRWCPLRDAGELGEPQS